MNSEKYAHALAVLLLASLLLNIALALSVRNLRTKLETVKAHNELVAGTAVPPLTGETVHGEPLSVDYSTAGVSTVIYVFAPRCGWSRRNEENLKALVNQAGGRYRIVAVSLSPAGVAEYWQRLNLPITVVSDVTRQSKIDYKLGGTPQTLVISPQSRVLKNWQGAYQGTMQKEIEEFFQVKLPGLSPP